MCRCFSWSSLLASKSSLTGSTDWVSAPVALGLGYPVSTVLLLLVSVVLSPLTGINYKMSPEILSSYSEAYFICEL